MYSCLQSHIFICHIKACRGALRTLYLPSLCSPVSHVNAHRTLQCLSVFCTPPTLFVLTTHRNASCSNHAGTQSDGNLFLYVVQWSRFLVWHQYWGFAGGNGELKFSLLASGPQQLGLLTRRVTPHLSKDPRFSSCLLSLTLTAEQTAARSSIGGKLKHNPACMSPDCTAGTCIIRPVSFLSAGAVRLAAFTNMLWLTTFFFFKLWSGTFFL